MSHHRKQYAIGGVSANKSDTVAPVIVYENSRHSTLLLNSDDKIDGTYADAIYQNNSRMIPGGVTSLGLSSTHINYRIPNINSRNNILRYMIDGDIGIYVAVFATDNRDTTTELYTAIIARMNALTPGIFSFTENIDGTVSLIATPGTSFKFISSSFIDYGRSCHGLYYTTNFEPEIRTIARLQYTRYIDIGVSELRNAIINNNSFGATKKFSSIDHLTRIYVDGTVAIPRLINNEVRNVDYFAFRDRALTNMSVTLYDEFEQVIWSDVVNVSGELVELPYISYELDFTLIS
jgi:hypothetical protein